MDEITCEITVSLPMASRLGFYYLMSLEELQLNEQGS